MTQNVDDDFIEWDKLSRIEQLQAEELLNKFDELYETKRDEESCTDLNSIEK